MAVIIPAPRKREANGFMALPGHSVASHNSRFPTREGRKAMRLKDKIGIVTAAGGKAMAALPVDGRMTA